MSHTRFALGFTLHKKIAKLSDAAFRLWVSAMDRARSQGTDGGLEHLDLDLVPHCPKKGARRAALAAELVSAGLWEVNGDGWQIHDYLDWQDSSERVVTRRRRAREHMRLVRAGVSANGGDTVSAVCATDASSFSSALILSDPSQTPDQTRSESTAGAKKSPFATEPEREVFEHWAEKLWPLVHKTGKPAPSPIRLSRIRARLGDGHSAADLKRAVDSVAQSKWHLGENDSGRAYIEPKTIFRNRETVDEWLSKRAGKPTGEQEHERQQAEADAALLGQIRRGEWGDKARARLVEQGTIDLEKFRIAMRDKRVTWRPAPAPGSASPTGTSNGAAPVQNDVSALVAGVARPMP